MTASWLRLRWDRLIEKATYFEPRNRALAVARTALAGVQLATIVWTPDRALFAADGVGAATPDCSGLKVLSLWCVGPADGTLTVRRFLAIAVLILVASGFRPRWTCVPHWYVTFSLTTTIGVADGGDAAARIATLLLIPVLLGDTRRWHWTAPADPMAPARRGAALAGLLLLRVQVVIIYGQAVWSKAANPVWREGTAMYYWLHSHYWGAPPAIQGEVFRLLDHGWFVRTLTWSVLVVEVGIAVSMAAPDPVRRWAVPAAVALHGGIIALMGLAGFGVTMMAVVLLACSDTLGAAPGRMRAVAEGPPPIAVPSGPPSAVPSTVPSVGVSGSPM